MTIEERFEAWYSKNCEKYAMLEVKPQTVREIWMAGANEGFKVGHSEGRKLGRTEATKENW